MVIFAPKIHQEMKRWLLLILCLLYVVASGGITLNRHYCRGELSSVSLNTTAGQCSRCGKTGTSCKHCKTISTFIQITTDQQTQTYHPEGMSPVVRLLFPCFSFTPLLPLPDRQPAFPAGCRYAPPDKKPCPLFLRQCVLLI